ncbi:alpha/beta fold hydrolase [Dactylosporangium sp. CA-233914]|uniref:alpha/beta fold hydrolase n=1 Tax=Dactylosporangium sp. CA-233914 TaxID=3239934 RepID=UPI003D9094AA
MAVPTISGAELGGSSRLPALVVGPSLGTSTATLWGAVADRLTDRFHVVGWDLPGHGSPVGEAFDMAELAAGVLTFVEDSLGVGREFAYAGDSVGGCVGLQLMLEHPARVRSAVLLCTGARIGDADGWTQRAALVRHDGTAAVVRGSADRWFAPGFRDREPVVADRLLHELATFDARGYAQVCLALAAFDVTERLPEISVPVRTVAGGHDVATPPASLRQIAERVQHGHAVVLDDVAHLAPAEAPDRVADLIAQHLSIRHPPRGEP